MYPEGRTSYKFKNFLRLKVTIVDKDAVKHVPQYVNKTFNYKDFKKKKPEIKDETTSKIKEDKDDKEEK